MSAKPTNAKRPKIENEDTEQSSDRISALPDTLLLHILSFLPTKDATKTTYLSKRWDHLWTHVSTLTFHKPSRSVNAINRALFLHQAPKIRKFSINLAYKDEFEDTINGWIHFAVQRKVEELHLEFYVTYLFRNFPYFLPQYLYKNALLRELKLKFISVSIFRVTVSWPSLIRLSLRKIHLNNKEMRNILSGCPLLEELVVSNCDGLESLNLTDTNVKSLRLFLYGHDIKICAPNLRSLSLHGRLTCLDYVFEDLSSLQYAELDFKLNAGSDSEPEYVRNHQVDETITKLRRFLEVLSHANVLSVRCNCIQMFSICEMINVLPPVCKRKRLMLETGLRKWELPGIFHLLGSSPEIETLIVKNSYSEAYLRREFREKHHFKKEKYWESKKVSIHCLTQLKSVRLYSIISQEEDIEETYSKPKFGEMSNECIHKKFYKEMELLKFLLCNAPALENMTIHISKKQNFEDEKVRKLILDMFETLLASPRASSRAKVSIF